MCIKKSRKFYLPTIKDEEPEKFAELVVMSNPSKFEDAEDIAKESLKLYINAYRLAERYSTIATNCYDTAEVIKELKKTDLQLK
ncbi:Uncharacterised protein [Staphylococcus aureus]|nr:hypothetical protein MQQ_00901 [Staphylococcus aureus subsp. aureus VRS9]SAO48378.1 Uncharacterised protein [Staphylococcus aureus]SAO54652.1 Uncharacterised protein [Staphylococcus aureus]SBD82019.1 Uncharacterised protein [Staphylococcus aureus]